MLGNTDLDSHLLAETCNLNIEEDNSTRALGLIWNNATDQFLFSLNNITEFSTQFTKRSVPSFIARLFDPLGWLAPLVVTAKIFMQELWVRRLDWDEFLPNDITAKWTSLINDFRAVPTIRIPRWLGIEKNILSIELHGFADASNKAFGAVVYIRIENKQGVRVSLIGSKTKVAPVAPLKSITIPRLELCAAVILVGLVKRVVNAMDLLEVPIYLWSDFTVALSWIRILFIEQIPAHILSADEIDHALLFWVRECQELHFNDEIKTLQKGQVLKTSSSLRRLTPFLDGNGFLRITGPLRFSSLDWDEKHPIVLPKEARITTLIIDSHHRRTLYGGTQLTLSSIRRRFWIIGGRVPVRAFIYRCMTCAKHRVEASQHIIGQLPPSRITPSRPCLHTGVDYAGPFQTKTFRGRVGKTYKGYLILLVCLVTSAIHLEVATDYSTSGFLAAYKRFSRRRGLCKCLYSDRGTNLIGADRELRQMFSAASREWKNMVDVLSNDGTQWRFNPPAAPHFGGKWEAGVRSVKTHLKKVVGSSLLTYEEFCTVLIQIEAVLNSRPLCALSEDPSSFEALTPAHFLVGSALTVVPEHSLFDERVSHVSRWQMLRRMVDDFWKKWEKFYLQHLQNSTKWFERKNIPEVSRLVLVKDERLPPSKWMTARVIELHEGAVGHPRVATIKTPFSTLVRPFSKLVLLPN